MIFFTYIYTLQGIIQKYMKSLLSLFVKEKRKALGMTQEDLSFKAGVGLRFIRELEQGKKTLRMDKVNQVLALFGHELGAVPMKRDTDID